MIRPPPARNWLDRKSTTAKYICYSLGNFCFGGNRNPEDKDTFIFRQTFTVSDDGAASDAGIEIVPCRISSTRRNDYQPTIYGEEDAKRVLKRLNEYSAPLKYGAVLRRISA